MWMPLRVNHTAHCASIRVFTIGVTGLRKAPHAATVSLLIAQGLPNPEDIPCSHLHHRPGLRQYSLVRCHSGGCDAPASHH